MGLALLNELQDRLHTAAIAGTQVLPEDFRLQKCVAQFAAIAPSSPVLTKIHQLLLPLADNRNANQSQTLLDAIMLVDAVVCTQATNKINGEMESLPSGGAAALTQQYRYGQIEPLHAALTTSGSGRYEIVRSAWKERAPVLNDFRLKSDLITALGDTYSEMADLVMEILCHADTDLVPALKRGFDKRGKKEMLRRLKVITALSGKEENEFYHSLLEGSSPEIRIGAIEALALSSENDELLIHLAETEKSNVKKAAWTALSEMDTPSAAEFWLNKLRKTATAAPYIVGNSSDALSDYVAEQLGNSLLSLLALPEGSQIDKHLYQALEKQTAAIVNKTSPKLFRLLRNFAEHRPHLATLRDEEDRPLLPAYDENTYSVFPAGYLRGDIIDLLNERLLCGIIQNPARYEKPLGTLFAETGNAYLTAALALRFFTAPDKTYDEFQPYFAHKGAERAILRCFSGIVYDQQRKNYHLESGYAATPDKNVYPYAPFAPSLDMRWFHWLTTDTESLPAKLLQSIGHARGRARRNAILLVRLHNAKDQALSRFLYPYFLNQAQYGDHREVLTALRDCGEKSFSGLPVRYLTKKSNHNALNIWAIQTLYTDLEIAPQDALADLQQILAYIETLAASNFRHYHTKLLKELIQKIEAGTCTTFEK